MTPIVILLLCAVCWQAEERAGCTAALSPHRCISNRTHKAAGRRANRTLNRKFSKTGYCWVVCHPTPLQRLVITFTLVVVAASHCETMRWHETARWWTTRWASVGIMFVITSRLSQSFVTHATSVRDHLLIAATFLHFLCSFSPSCQERVPSCWENKQTARSRTRQHWTQHVMDDFFIWRHANVFIANRPSTYIFF